MSGRRFSRTDWLELGLAALSTEGPPGITIEAMCRRSGKTKGSFYAHFPDAATFARMLAEHWRERNTERIISAVKTSRPTSMARAKLDEMASSLDHDAEREMRRLAARDHAVAEVLRLTDRERISFVTEQYRATQRFSDADAEALARVEYALFLAFQHSPPEERQAYRESYERYLRIIGLDTA